MRKVKNVEIYNDDFKIAEILQNIPKSEDVQNKEVPRFFEENGKSSDFATIIPGRYSLYVCYKSEEHGFTLTVSKVEHVDEQIEVWRSLKAEGQSFYNTIYNGVMAGLVALQVVNDSLEE